MVDKLSVKRKRIITATLLISVSILGLTIQIQNDTVVRDTSEDKSKKIHYNHPFLQTFLMFVGEGLGILLYIDKRRRLNRTGGNNNDEYLTARDNGLKMNINPIMFIPAAILDMASSTLLFISTIEIKGSLSQLFSSFDIIVVSIGCKFFFKMKLYRHHYLGIAIQFLFLAFISIYSFVLQVEELKNDNMSIGIPCAILSMLLFSLDILYLQWLFKTYYIDPYQIVGFMGLWGIALSGIVLVILQLISGTNSSFGTNGHVDDSLDGFKEIISNLRMIILVVLNTVGVVFYNYTFIVILKYISCLSSLSIIKVRPVVSFIFFTILHEKGITHFGIFQMVGLVFLTLGILIFNEILVIPFCGLDYNISKKRAKREHDNRTVSQAFLERLATTQIEAEFNREIFGRTTLMSQSGHHHRQNSIAVALENSNQN